MGSRISEEKRLSHFADGAETSVNPARSCPGVEGAPDLAPGCAEVSQVSPS